MEVKSFYLERFYLERRSPEGIKDKIVETNSHQHECERTPSFWSLEPSVEEEA